MARGSGSGRDGGGRGGGGRGGTGQGCGDQGRMGGFGRGMGGNCICPKCGHAEPHRRGNPCNQIECPECGTTLTRQM